MLNQAENSHIYGSLFR